MEDKDFLSSPFILIAITQPYDYPEEAKIITELLEKGIVKYVHIRKPNWNIEETENLIKEIPASFHSQIKLHDHFELLFKYNLGGLHLNSRNPEPLGEYKEISKSFHTLNEIETEDDKLDYFFISPVYDSISKEGYKAAFDLDLLEKKIKGKRAIALGGVTPDKILELKKAGFYGAAMLGYFFPETR